MSNFEEALAKFETVFSTELAEDIRSIPEGDDIYAYAIEVPDDTGNLYIISAIACDSKYRSQFSSMTDVAWWEKILFAFTDRYSAPSWSYRGDSFESANTCLSRMQESFFSTSEEKTLSERQDLLYAAVLRQMKSSKAEGNLLPNCLNLIILSDSEHRVSRESFRQLNSLRLIARLWPLYNVHWTLYCPIAALGNLGARLFGKNITG